VIGGRPGIVRAIEPLLGERELHPVVQPWREDARRNKTWADHLELTSDAPTPAVASAASGLWGA